MLETNYIAVQSVEGMQYIQQSAKMTAPVYRPTCNSHYAFYH